jgi:uncharacterized membrane protein
MNTTTLIAKKASVNLIKVVAFISAGLGFTFVTIKSIAWVLVNYFDELPQSADLAAIPYFCVAALIVMILAYAIDKARLDVKLEQELEEIRNK